MQIKNPRVIAVLPAYNAAGSLEKFFKGFPFKVFDQIILVDDDSKDGTFELAKKIIREIGEDRKVEVFKNRRNLGYGGNMKRCLDLALKTRADIIIEIHPDGEYGFDGIEPALKEIKKGAGLVLGNRFTKTNPQGMYFWKIPFTKALTGLGNLILGTNIPDMHQGFRVYSRDLLQKINYHKFSNDFLFTFEVILETFFHELSIASVPVTSYYHGQKRGVNFKTSFGYSLKTLKLLIQLLFRHKLSS